MAKIKEKFKLFSSQCCKSGNGGGTSSAVYGLGFIGALVFYLQHAPDVGSALLGVLKALVWPAIMVYHLVGLFKL
jgi:hypothetical protein